MKRQFVSWSKRNLLSVFSVGKRCLVKIRLRAGEKNFSSKNVRCILLMRLDGLGDLVLTLPAIRNIRAIFPRADITVLVSNGLGDLIRSTSYADNVWDNLERRKGLKEILRFIVQLRKHRFDLAIDLMPWSDRLSALILFFTRASFKSGCDVGWRSFCLNIRVAPPKEMKYEVENVLDIIRLTTGETVDSSLILPVGPESQKSVNLWLKELECASDELLIGIHPGAAELFRHKKAWAAEKFSQLGNFIMEKYKAKVFLIGGPGEIALCETIARQMNGKAIIVAGKIDIVRLVALMSRMTLFIGNHSGPLHLSLALKVPAVVISGPTDLIRWGPQGQEHIVVKKNLTCMPCEELGLRCLSGDFRCMSSISVGEVAEAVDRQLNKRFSRRRHYSYVPRVNRETNGCVQ